MFDTTWWQSRFSKRLYFWGMKWMVASLSTLLLLSACNGDDTEGNPDTPADPKTATAPILSHTVVDSLPHDTSAYTQGLEFYKGQLYESTGNYGFSKLRRVDLRSGSSLQETKLDTALFGEGLTVLHDTLYQLTWQEKKLLAYDPKSLKKLAEYPIRHEGWGLTNNGRELIATDGSNNLYFYEPGTMWQLRVQGVYDNGAPVAQLNEMEWINGALYANQYQYPYVYKINPKTGAVLARLDFTDLVTRVRAAAPYAKEFNGIAYDSSSKKVYVTGKHWPNMYEVKFDF